MMNSNPHIINSSLFRGRPPEGVLGDLPGFIRSNSVIQIMRFSSSGFFRYINIKKEYVRATLNSEQVRNILQKIYDRINSAENTAGDKGTNWQIDDRSDDLESEY